MAEIMQSHGRKSFAAPWNVVSNVNFIRVNQSTVEATFETETNDTAFYRVVGFLLVQYI
jgi:hypothetical protein